MIHESQWLPQAMILPLQMVMMNVFSRTLRNGEDPHRIFQLDELTKYLVSAKLLEYLEGLAVEVRHRPVTTVLGAQRVKNLPEGILSLATITGVFNIQSPAEFKKAQGATGVLHGVSHEDQVRRLKRGQLLLGSLQASHPEFVEKAQHVDLRPAAMDPGGETYEIM